MDGENNGKPYKRIMIWGYPYFWKHPYKSAKSSTVRFWFWACSSIKQRASQVVPNHCLHVTACRASVPVYCLRSICIPLFGHGFWSRIKPHQQQQCDQQHTFVSYASSAYTMCIYQYNVCNYTTSIHVTERFYLLLLIILLVATHDQLKHAAGPQARKPAVQNWQKQIMFKFN